jgi:hypothetical protein
VHRPPGASLQGPIDSWPRSDPDQLSIGPSKYLNDEVLGR